MKAEGELEICLDDGATINVTEFRHMSMVRVNKGDARVEIVLGKESDNTIDVKVIAPLQS